MSGRRTSYRQITQVCGFQFFAALSRRVDGWMHHRVAVGAGTGAALELGAGNLNHLSYEVSEWDLSSYDIVEPQEYLYQRHTDISSIRNVYNDIDQVPDGNQ